jgi:hypothetical protein
MIHPHARNRIPIPRFGHPHYRGSRRGLLVKKVSVWILEMLDGNSTPAFADTLEAAWDALWIGLSRPALSALSTAWLGFQRGLPKVEAGKPGFYYHRKW